MCPFRDTPEHRHIPPEYFEFHDYSGSRNEIPRGSRPVKKLHIPTTVEMSESNTDCRLLSWDKPSRASLGFFFPFTLNHITLRNVLIELPKSTSKAAWLENT